MTDISATPNYEEMFANRFTTEDHEYQAYLSRPETPPPLVEDWRGRGPGHSRGRDNRYQDRGHRGRDQGRGWDGGRGRDRDRDRGWDGGRGWGGGRDRDRDRDRGWGGENRGHQRSDDRDHHGGWGQGTRHPQGPSSYNQMYNSSNERPHHDRY